MKKIIHLFLVGTGAFLFFISCSNKKDEVNKTQKNQSSDRLSKEELIPIVKDVLLVESAIYFKANQGADIKTLTYFYYNKIFEKHNVSRNQFYSSLKYYLQKDITASIIFQGAINILTVETDSVRKNETSLKVPDMSETKSMEENKKPIRFFGKPPK